MKYILSVSFFALCLSGCNPARRIYIKNNSGHDAQITLMINEDSVLNSPFFMNNSKKVKYELKSGKPYNSVHLSLGMGGWTNRELQNITDDLDSLIIQSNNGEIKLGTEEIKGFLASRRKGNKIHLFINE